MNERSAPRSWIIGRGGLLGRAVSQFLTAPGREWVAAGSVPWENESLAKAALDRMLHQFSGSLEADRPWQIFWCAGAGVVATSPDALKQETAVLTHFTGLLRRAVLSGKLTRMGSFFLASSAGGVYAASPTGPPYHESSQTGTLSPYGVEKLRHETLFSTLSRDTGVPLLVGRISNLYGPGQNMTKPQGLITQVGRATLLRVPARIYVSLDTIRDYIFAADAAQVIVRGMERMCHEQPPDSEPVVKVIASEVDTTIASVLGTWRQVLKRPPGLVLVSSPASRMQPSRLSFRSHKWRDVHGPTTPLVVGIAAVYQGQLKALLSGELAVAH